MVMTEIALELHVIKQAHEEVMGIKNKASSLNLKSVDIHDW